MVVADGQSTGGTREILAKMEERRGERADGGNLKPEVRGPWSVVGGPILQVIDNPGRPTSHGLNAAIDAARGQIIVRMSPDTGFRLSMSSASFRDSAIVWGKRQS